MSMFHWRRPAEAWIRRRLEAAADDAITYPEVGYTQLLTPSLEDRLPAGRYDIDRRWNRLGRGERIWNLACEAVRTWEMFRVGWVDLCYPEAPQEPGSVVGVLANTHGAWSLNVSRIIYVVDETTETGRRRFGFAYGTLSHHVEQGEELFTVEWEPSDDTVWYCITAFSRPHHWLVRAMYPFARKTQRYFGHSSLYAMRHAVGTAPDGE